MTVEIPAAGYEAKVARDWLVPQGADTTNSLRYGTRTGDDDPVYPDLSAGWSARAQMRAEAGGIVWVTFLSTSLTGPRIALEADGYVTVILPAETTEAAAWNDFDNGYYDVELLSPDGGVIRLARGSVTVTHDYTRTGS